MTIAKITPFQFYTILYLGRIFSFVTYISNIRVQLTSSEMFLGTLLMGVYMVITAVPMIIFIKTDSESSIITRAECLSKPFAKVVCVLYIANYYFYGIMAASRFEIFASSVMFPERNVSFIVLTLLIATAYVAAKGIEPIGRAAAAFLVPVLLTFLFVFSTSAKDFDMLNFTPMLTKNVSSLFDIGFYTCTSTCEMLSIGIMLPYIKNQKVRDLPIWIGVLFFTILVSNVMMSGVLGSFSSTQLFGMYSMSVLAEFGFVERMDAIITCVWMICAVIKLSLIFFITNILFTKLFGKKHKTIYLAVSVLVVFAGMFLISHSIIHFFDIVTSPVQFVIYCVSACAIPLIILIGERFTTKGAKHEKT